MKKKQQSAPSWVKQKFNRKNYPIWGLIFVSFLCFILLFFVHVPAKTPHIAMEKIPLYRYLLSRSNQDGQRPQNKDSASLKSLSVLEVKAFDFSPYISAWGEVQSASGNALIINNEVPSKVISLGDISIGKEVKAGDILISLDDKELILSLSQAEAKLKELKEALLSAEALLPLEEEVLSVAEKAYGRYQDLAAKNVTSSTNLEGQLRTYIQAQQAVQNHRSNIASLKAQIQNQQAAVTQAQYNLEKTKIKAPVDGRILEIMVQKGQYINGNTNVIRMLNFNEQVVRAQFSLSKILDFLGSPQHFSSLEGSEAYFSLNEGEKENSWPLRLSSLPAEISSESRNISMLFQFDDNKNAPLLGSFGEVYLKAPLQKTAMIIPRESLKNGYVYLLDEHNKIYRRPVDYSFIGDQWAWVKKGLNKGDKLIIYPPSPFINGQEYKPLPHKEILEKLEQFILNAKDAA